jgi:hypothetical protein
MIGAMDARSVTHTLLFAAQLAAAVLGLAAAIASVSGMVSDLTGLIGWLVSTIALMRLLTVRRPRAGGEGDRPQPYSIAVRMLLASIAVFCISIVLVLVVVLRSQVPMRLNVAALNLFSILVLVSTLAVAACFVVTRR